MADGENTQKPPDPRSNVAREVHDPIDADRFLRRVREDFYDEDNCCNLCRGEELASIMAFQAVAMPGMSEGELAVAVWDWMHVEGPWAWKHKLQWTTPEQNGRA
jgi:hypothetical protein